MNNLVDNIRTNRLFAFMLGQTGLYNKPADFVIGEEVIVMNPIDYWDDNIKPGMKCRIDNIMHRYKGEPAEHHEFWVLSESGRRGRFEVNNILKYTTVEKFINEWKPPT